ncbi:MAG: M15 family metallopeptidase [Sulfurovaceae bacterium]|nr:M15 family metallopeptidase [Sulfurovaceae bacterium]
MLRNIPKKLASLFFLLLSLSLTALCDDKILSLDDTFKKEMYGTSYHNGCPVEFDDLKLVKVKYLGFDGYTKNGELIVHKSIANEVASIFDELYKIGYPIKQIVRIDKYNGSDFDSIEADNTSAFNCRKATGENSWSKHSFGKAIDINPIENPYIFSNGRTSHKASYKYVNRDIQNPKTPQEKAVFLPNSKAVMIFKRYGWRWGGDWRVKDYQHFDKQ